NLRMKEMQITDIVPDNLNINLGTEDGKRLLEESLRRLGAGRSILLDKNNRVVAGNKTLEAAIKLGLVKVKVVDTDGTELVAVKRGDLDLDTKEGREMAIADNAVAAANIRFDENALRELTERFGLNRESLGFDKENAAPATEKEIENYELNEVPHSKAVCPMCFTEFPWEENEVL
ncbi:MAG: hypothetical protein LUE27_04355, partial [Clostridia bacterium]|nr:hypothetical protein [Clostridia bacterium]